MKRQDIDQMKDAMRAPWIAGNFGAIAKTIGAPAAEGFVARLELEPDVRVLDIACGTGNVTLPLARRGATVTGLDMTPHCPASTTTCLQNSSVPFTTSGRSPNRSDASDSAKNAAPSVTRLTRTRRASSGTAPPSLSW